MYLIWKWKKREWKIQPPVAGLYALYRCSPASAPAQVPACEKIRIPIFTVYDTTNCIRSATAVPWHVRHGIPSFGENGKMIKCDGCYGESPSRNAAGLCKSMPGKGIAVSRYRSKRASDPGRTFFADDQCGNAEASGIKC